jgi:hypothetical protein
MTGSMAACRFELALDLRRDAALLAARIDLELEFGRGVVTAIVGIGNATIEHGLVSPPPGLAALLDAALAFELNSNKSFKSINASRKAVHRTSRAAPLVPWRIR